MTRFNRRVLAVCAAVSAPAFAVNLYALATSNQATFPWLPLVGAAFGWIALTCWAIAPSRHETETREGRGD